MPLDLTFTDRKQHDNDCFSTTAEVIGWIGRTWSASCPYNNDAFLMQITTLIIGMLFSLNTGWTGVSA